MSDACTEAVREKVLALIASTYDSDAAFERAANIPDKTVNNWRRGRSASFMRMLPELSRLFGTGISELLSLPVGRDSSELSEDEMHLVHLYRKSRTIPKPLRAALRETLESTINLYTESAKVLTQKPAKPQK